MRTKTMIDCAKCGKHAVSTPPARGPKSNKCDDCRPKKTKAARATECAVCNVSLPTAPRRGRPSKVCSDRCRDEHRRRREASPEVRAARHGRETKRARSAAGQPEVLNCIVCELPVDASIPGPHGDLETGFAVHAARGSDPTGEHFSCKDRYEAMRKAQRLQTNKRARRQ